MSWVLGAWALAEGALERHLPAGLRARLRAALPGGAPPLAELRGPRLWLLSPETETARRGEELLAWCGFLALGARAPSSLLTGAALEPVEGHAVLAHLRDPGGPLELRRHLAGGERLYFAPLGDLVLFASSVLPLLAHPALGPRLDPRVADQLILWGRSAAGDRSPWEGIRELLPGHGLLLGDRLGEQAWVDPERLASAEGPPEELATRYREALTDAVAACAGSSRPVAVALSGGIDSSAVAAAAVDAFGAEQVVAFTYEFDDPEHGRETEFAQQVCRSLGIRDHRVFPLDRREYLAAVPEQVWRSECPVHWPKAFLLLVARHIQAEGFDRYLTGFGIGSHTGHLGELAAWLPRLPARGWLYRGWARHVFRREPGNSWAQALHPAFEPAHPRIFHLLVRVLEAEGLLPDFRSLYPEALAALVEDPETPPPLVDSDPALSLARRLQLAACRYLVSCVDVTRSERASRQVGAARLAPAHLARVLPFAYFPPLPAPGLLDPERRQRPGKALLQRAYRGRLPDEVLFRVKDWSHAVAGQGWVLEARVRMLRALPGFPEDLAALRPGYPRAALAWAPASLQCTPLAFAFFRRVLAERPGACEPPTWEELIPPRPARRAAG